MRSKVMKVFANSWKNATEQHYQDNKIDKNDGTELECTLNSMNLDYLINHSSFCDEGER